MSTRQKNQRNETEWQEDTANHHGMISDISTDLSVSSAALHKDKPNDQLVVLLQLIQGMEVDH